MTSCKGSKDELRTRLLAARRKRSASDLAAARAEVREHAVTLAGTLDVACVGAYEPLRTEPGSTELLAALKARGLRVLVPHTLPDRDLDWREWSPAGGGALLGLDAIGAAGLIVVPALAVAYDGTRLGRGGGSYDRALARRAPTAQVWALVFDGELVDDLPRDPWDVPVDVVLAPAGPTTLPRNTAERRAR